MNSFTHQSVLLRFRRSCPGDAVGILTFGDLTGTGTIDQNVFGTISAHASSTNAYGISIGGNVSGSIEANKFTTSISSAMNQATGINIGGDLTETGKVEQNEFAEISSPAEVVGSDGAATFGMYVKGSIAGSINDNTFTNISSPRLEAYGLWLNQDIKATAKITGNIFNVISSNNSVGLRMSGGYFYTGATISGNTFNSTTTLNTSAAGIEMNTADPAGKAQLEQFLLKNNSYGSGILSANKVILYPQ